ncbi:MAG: hypothetical protein M3300_02280, partial [Actinomycetota bacterium]|nr:hypothetical protein [Actinomycetota bacterium]
MCLTSLPPPSRRWSEQLDPGQLAEAVAAAVRAHPAVADLDGGPFGTIACYLPGRRVVGVRIGEPGQPVDVSVVARLGTPLPQLATELRRMITAVSGPRVIDLTINDVITGDSTPTSLP